MCDSVGFIRPCHWTGDSDLGELCPGGLCPVTVLYTDGSVCKLVEFTESKRRVFQDVTVDEPAYYHTFYVDPHDDNSIYIGALWVLLLDL